MSTELSIFKAGLPAYLKADGLDADTKAMAGGGTYKRISLRGKAFRMVVGGEEIAVREERAMTIVIVRMAHSDSRTFFEGAYVEGQAIPPSCWSTEGVVPDEGVEAPVSKSCATCPNNIKGSGKGESKACSTSRRMAVVLADDIEGDIYQLVMPSTSVYGKGEQNKWPLKQYVQYLAANGVQARAAVTEMKFDINADGIKLVFRPTKLLSQEEYEIVCARGEEPEAVNALKMSVSQTDGVKAKAKAAPAVATKPVIPAKPPIVAEEFADEDDGVVDVVEVQQEAAPVRRATKAAEKPVTPPDDKMKNLLSKWDDDGEE